MATPWTFRNRSDYITIGEFDVSDFDEAGFDVNVSPYFTTAWVFRTRSDIEAMLPEADIGEADVAVLES